MLWKASDGRWRGHVTDTGGRRHTRTGVTEEACAVRLDTLKKEIEAGVVARGTVGSWVAGQIMVAKANGELPRSSTVKHRTYLAGLIPEALAATKVEQVDKAAVDAALDFIEHGHQTGSPVSRTTVGRVRALMVAAWQDALDNDAARVNAPARTRPRTTEAKDPVWLDVDHARRLLAVLDGHPWRALYIVLATVGLRRSELLGMRWDCIDLEAGVLRIRWTLVKLLSGEMVLKSAVKNKASRRTIPLPHYAADAIREHHEQFGEVSEFMWGKTALRVRRKGQDPATPEGIPHPDSLRGPLARACRTAGVPHVTPHQLRHSAATIAHMRRGRQSGPSWTCLAILIPELPPTTSMCSMPSGKAPAASWTQRGGHSRTVARRTQTVMNRLPDGGFGSRFGSHDDGPGL